MLFFASVTDQFFDIRTSKSAPRPSVFNILTWKCASRHSGVQHQNFKKCSEAESEVFCTFSLQNFRHSSVQFFDIRTSKSAPNLTRFVHFHFKTCFSQQRRAVFRHQNFKNCSEPDVSCTFPLQNVLVGTAACIF